MEIQEYAKRLKDLYNVFLTYIDDDDESSTSKKNLEDYLKDENLSKNSKKLDRILHLLVNISANHFRYPDYSERIRYIINLLEDNIKQTYSNSEIFEIFKTDKFLLLYLIERKIFKFDQETVQQMLKYEKEYGYYFYPEIKDLISTEQKNEFTMSEDILTDFEEKRKTGENESYIASLIRNDSVEQFISFINRQNLPLSSHLESSIFETNPYLISRTNSIIDYSAFFGAIQIFQYLKMNQVQITPYLLPYSIHSNNAELIHLIEENFNEKYPNNFISECLLEAVKCHHNEVARYFLQKSEDNYLFNEKNENDFLDFCFKFDNFDLLPDQLDERFMVFYIEYFYNDLVIILLNSKRVSCNDYFKMYNISKKKISRCFFFNFK